LGPAWKPPEAPVDRPCLCQRWTYVTRVVRFRGSMRFRPTSPLTLAITLVAFKLEPSIPTLGKRQYSIAGRRLQKQAAHPVHELVYVMPASSLGDDLLTDRLKSPRAEVLGQGLAVEFVERPQGRTVVAELPRRSTIGPSVVRFSEGPETRRELHDRDLL